MAWEGSDRLERLPDNWAALRAERLRIDGHRCTWRLKSRARCPRPATDVDHRKPGDDHRMENLQSLCAHHHGRKSAIEGYQAKRARRAPRRAPEQQPGRLR